MVADLEVLGPLAAADAAEEGNTAAGRLVGGMVPFGKTAQMTMVRLELQTWDRGMCRHLRHRLLTLAAPLVRPGHDPDGVASSPRRQVGVGQRRRVGTRSNEDA